MNTRINSVKLMAIAAASVVVFTLASAQAQTPASKIPIDSLNNRSEFRLEMFRFAVKRQALPLRPAGFRLMPEASARINASAMMPMAGSNLQVLGSGTVGRLTKWTGITSSNSLIGDSTIFESKTGLVGIGTDSPTSRLTVAGMIETTLGGLKFPDGTVQTTAGLASLFHDATLQGNGTSGSPLGVAIPLNLSGSVLEPILTMQNNGDGGQGMRAIGGNSVSFGGTGLDAIGGTSSSGDSNDQGGRGIVANGGNNTSSGMGGIGVLAFAGASSSGVGGIGVVALGGISQSGIGGDGMSATGGTGVGAGNSGGVGIIGRSGLGVDGATSGLAGRFEGDVQVTGNLSKGGGSFKIDHPLDPENKYLYHSFVESPDMKNIYDGSVTTDAIGDAVITLPDYFDALNSDFRYQLTVIGVFAQAIVAEKIKGNRFTIKTSAPNVEVSWQVTGIRKDAYANKYRIPVEESKGEHERGFYLHPDVFNQPDERGVVWSGHPEMMQPVKQARLKIKAQSNDR